VLDATQAPSTTAVCPVSPDDVAVTNAVPPLPVEGAASVTLATPDTVVPGDATTPALALNPTCVGAAIKAPPASRRVAVTLPTLPQATVPGPDTTIDAGAAGVGEDAHAPSGTSVCAVRPAAVAVTCAEPPAPVEGADIATVARPAAVIDGEAIVPSVLVKLTCVGVAIIVPPPSLRVAVTLPVEPQARDAGPFTVREAATGAAAQAPSCTSV
jgi:hypothetical protein